MSRVPLPWLWASLVLHAGLFEFSREGLGASRRALQLQPPEIELLAEAAERRAPPPLWQRAPEPVAPPAVAREQRAQRPSAARGLAAPARSSEPSRQSTSSEPPAPAPTESASALTPPLVEAPLLEASVASPVPAGTEAQAGTAIAARGAPAALAGAPAAVEDLGALRRRYLEAVRERVLAHREYPHAAQRAGLQGTVCVRFSVTASGRLSALRLTCRGAPEALLQAALRALRAAQPFAPLPSALGSEVSVDLPVVFRLDAL